MAVFGSLLIDTVVAFFFGLVGGVAAELIDNKGSIGIPFIEVDEQKKPKNRVNLGLFSKMIVGGVAALAFFFLADTADPLKFVGATVAAGFGGSATLVAVKEKILGAKREGLEDVQSNQARQAIRLVEKMNSRLPQALADRDGLEIKGEAESLETAINQTDLELKKLR